MPWRETKRPVVYIDGVRNNFVHLLDVKARYGNQPETATFEFRRKGDDPDRSILENNGLVFDNSRVNIHIDDNRGRRKYIHFGRVAQMEVDSNGTSESLVFTSQFDKHMFGIPIRGCDFVYYNPDGESGRQRVTDGDGIPIVMNPAWQGERIFNRMPQTRHGRPITYSAFIIPGQSTWDSQDRRPWTLASAVNFLCRSLNFKQKYIKNPSQNQLRLVLPEIDLLQDIKFDFGMYLPEALDTLLKAYGYCWKVEHVTRNLRKFQFFPRDGSALVNLNRGAVDETADSKVDNVQINIKSDMISRSCNHIIVIGGHAHIETRFELGSDFSNDPLESFSSPSLELPPSAYSLKQIDRLSSAKDRDILLKACRRFVLQRSAWRPTMFYQALGSIKFEPFVEEQKFLPNISQDSSGRPLGNISGRLVEVYDPQLKRWMDVSSMKQGSGVEFMKNELGVYFNSDMPPPLFVRNRTYLLENPMVRVTAVLKSPSRVIYEHRLPNGAEDDVTMVLDMEHQFPFRTIDRSSITGSSAVGKSTSTTEVNSLAAMQTFATQLLMRHRHAFVNGQITMPGVDWNARAYIGRALHTINGINYFFNTATGSRPLIRGIDLDFQSQATVLHIGNT